MRNDYEHSALVIGSATNSYTPNRSRLSSRRQADTLNNILLEVRSWLPPQTILLEVSEAVKPKFHGLLRRLRLEVSIEVY
jgi:hypothetical protein